MTLSDRIQLIDDMIRKNPEYTIRDYLDLVNEINQIKNEDMGSRKGIPNIPEDKKLIIIRLAQTKSVAEICEIMGISPNCIYKACARGGTSIRAIRHQEILEPAQPPALEVNKPKKYVRPPAEYSNHSPFGIAS